MDVDHRALAASLFNQTWTYLDRTDRGPDDDDAMLMTAFASLYHWSQAGTQINLARGHWQVSRVYAVLSRAGEAGYHAQRCLDLCRAAGVGDFDLAFAYEALARAAALGGDRAAAQRWTDQAYRAAADIAEDEDRDLVLADLATIDGISPPERL